MSTVECPKCGPTIIDLDDGTCLKCGKQVIQPLPVRKLIDDAARALDHYSEDDLEAFTAFRNARVAIAGEAVMQYVYPNRKTKPEGGN